MSSDILTSSDPPLLSYRPALLAALALVVALCLSVGGWGMAARLDAAIVSAGVLHADSERKTVEHLEGGILSEVLVRPGNFVEAGEVVARLDATQVREQLVQLSGMRETHLFDLWRLGAERVGATPDAARAPGPEQGVPSTHRSKLLSGAFDLAVARKKSHAAQVDALERQIAQFENQIAAHDAQMRAAARQLSVRAEELGMVESLVARGVAARARVWELQRAIAVLEGQRDEERGLMNAARDQISRARAEILALEETRQVEISTQINEARAGLSAVESQIRVAEDVLERHHLRAPQSGYVVDLSIPTRGAVLPPGEPLMTILPADDELVALLRLSPTAIDSVSVGQPAEIRLSAYRRVDAPVLAGRVAFVSADLLEDPQSEEGYFEVRISLDAEDVAALSEAHIVAGMPVEVTIAIEARRAGDYMLEPILRHVRRALREE